MLCEEGGTAASLIACIYLTALVGSCSKAGGEGSFCVHADDVCHCVCMCVFVYVPASAILLESIAVAVAAAAVAGAVLRWAVRSRDRGLDF